MAIWPTCTRRSSRRDRQPVETTVIACKARTTMLGLVDAFKLGNLAAPASRRTLLGRLSAPMVVSLAAPTASSSGRNCEGSDSGRAAQPMAEEAYSGRNGAAALMVLIRSPGRRPNRATTKGLRLSFTFRLLRARNKGDQAMTAIDRSGTFTLGERTVRRLGYGAMQLSGPGVFGPPKDPRSAIAVLLEAVACGVNHIDTSDYYGPHATNRLIREALAPYPDGLVIVTKVGARRGSDASWLPAFSPEDLAQAVHDNLTNLGLDVLEVVNL